MPICPIGELAEAIIAAGTMIHPGVEGIAGEHGITVELVGARRSSEPMMRRPPRWRPQAARKQPISVHDAATRSKLMRIRMAGDGVSDDGWWSVEPGDYVVGNPGSGLAISTLSDEELLRSLAERLNRDRYAILGMTRTQN
jgi:hypothetical protein